MNDTSQNIESMRKRLLWRATHRGIKEMDLIVGGFAAARLESMELAALSEFEGLLEVPDQQLLAWLTKQETLPENLRSPLLLEMLAFRPEVLK
jgi:antitoxin CptB